MNDHFGSPDTEQPAVYRSRRSDRQANDEHYTHWIKRMLPDAITIIVVMVVTLVVYECATRNSQ